MKVDLSNEFSITVAISECPDTHHPFVSVGCLGNICENLMKPCQSNDECGSELSCQNIMDNTTVVPTRTEITELMQSMLLSEGDCLTEEDFMDKLANFILSEFYLEGEVSGFLDDPKFCMSDELQSLENTLISSETSEDSILTQCAFEYETVFVCYQDYSRVENPESCPPNYWCWEYDEDNNCIEYYCLEEGVTEEYDSESGTYVNVTVCLEYYCNTEIYDAETGEYICQHYYESSELAKVDCHQNGEGFISSWDGETTEGDNVFDWVSENPFDIPDTGIEAVTSGAVPVSIIFVSYR